MKFSCPVRKKILFDVPIFGKVCPLKRPRLNRQTGGVYQPKDNQELLYEQMALYKRETICDPVIIDTFYVFKTNQKKDLDNLDKAVNDCLVAMKILQDDVLICGHQSYKCKGPEDITRIIIWSSSTESKEMKIV